MILWATAPQGFWDITAGNIITWLFFATAVVVARYMDLRLLQQRMKTHEKWRDQHEEDARQRDEMIRELQLANMTLTQLAKDSERRLQRLENHEDDDWRTQG